MLGHASAAMTLDVYAGLFGDDLDAVADGLDRMLGVPQLSHIEGSPDDRDLAAAPVARPADLRKCVVGPVGLEPTTGGLKVRCSTD